MLRFFLPNSRTTHRTNATSTTKIAFAAFYTVHSLGAAACCSCLVPSWCATL